MVEWTFDPYNNTGEYLSDCAEWKPNRGVTARALTYIKLHKVQSCLWWQKAGRWLQGRGEEFAKGQEDALGEMALLTDVAVVSGSQVCT